MYIWKESGSGDIGEQREIVGRGKKDREQEGGMQKEWLACHAYFCEVSCVVPSGIINRYNGKHKPRGSILFPSPPFS